MISTQIHQGTKKPKVLGACSSEARSSIILNFKKSCMIRERGSYHRGEKKRGGRGDNEREGEGGSSKEKENRGIAIEEV